MVGGEPLLPRLLEAALRATLAEVPERAVPVRLVRWTRSRAIVEIPHMAVSRARERWNAGPENELAAGGTPVPRFRTVRTWGTLVQAKAWLRRAERPN